MKNFLLPTDYSTHANNAFFYALQLANKIDVELYVMFTYSPPVLSSVHAGQPEMVTSVYQEIDNSRYEYHLKKNNELTAEANQRGINTDKLSFLFEHGTVLGSVKKVIAEKEIDLIVMGVHGVTGFKHEFMGSNTKDVINNIKKPVLAIPLNAKYNGIKNIGFTTLFKEKDFPALKEIAEISTIVDAKVYCIHVNSGAVKEDQVLMQAENWMKNFKNSNISFSFLDKENTIEETVNKFILNNQIDVLTIVRRNRNFFDRLISSSLSTKLTFHAEIPIFVFHES